MKLTLGKYAVAQKDKPSHEEVLFEYIAGACEYNDQRWFNTKKGALNNMLRVTGIKYNTAYRRSRNKLIKLGLVKRLMPSLGGAEAIYMLTSEGVRICKEYRSNDTHCVSNPILKNNQLNHIKQKS